MTTDRPALSPPSPLPPAAAPPDPAAPGPAASGPAAPDPAASDPAASGPAASGPAASSPAASSPAGPTAVVVASDPAVGEPVAGFGPVLVVTAVEPEAAAVRAGLAARSPAGPPGDRIAVEVVAVGVGSAEAAAGTARLLALAEVTGRPYAGVICAGIGGALPGRADVGAIVIATRSIAADLGADSPDGYLPIEQLGFGNSTALAHDVLSALIRAALPEALVGDVLTVNTVTGTTARATELAARHPAAIVEAMEGYGVAIAARTADVPFAELRTVSNPVGPRDRTAWNLPAAFTSLTVAFASVATLVLSPTPDEAR